MAQNQGAAACLAFTVESNSEGRMQIFDFFLSVVRHYPPDAARQEFRSLFFDYRANAMNRDAFADLQEIVQGAIARPS
ncbi:MAG: hypothetical protein HC838_08725 [Spirulinaceae cyanobacterium RM2_2_10]|nr:hypothetical protein [Spirulinaceae cyanobacterium RM2_2_10]